MVSQSSRYREFLFAFSLAYTVHFVRLKTAAFLSRFTGSQQLNPETPDAEGTTPSTAMARSRNVFRPPPLHHTHVPDGDPGEIAPAS
jgi:hypothetical protein